MLALNAEQEQALIAKLFEKISPLLPQHIRDNVKPALRDLVDNEDSVFDTTARSPSAFGVTDEETPNVAERLATVENALKCLQSELRMKNKALEYKEEQNKQLHLRIKDLGTHKANEEARLSHIEVALSAQIRDLHLQMNQLAQDQDNFLIHYDENYAEMMQEIETNKLQPKAIQEMEAEIQKLKEICDALEQYSRHEILEFHEVPYCKGHGKIHNEDTTEAIVELVTNYLGINISKFDISVSHRMNLPANKSSVPPIYCKFVHRSLAHKILRRSHWLKSKPNRIVNKIQIKPNLTLIRRTLFERAEKELKTYKHTWSKNGNVFVRKNNRSKAIKVNTEEKLEELIASKRKFRKPAASENPQVKEPAVQTLPTTASTKPAAESSDDVPENDLVTNADEVTASGNHVPKAVEASSQNVVKSTPCSSAFPRLPVPLPSLIPSQRFPPSGFTHTRVPSSGNTHTNSSNVIPTYSYLSVAADFTGNSYVPYAPSVQRQLYMGNRNSLLSPGQQRLMLRAQSSTTNGRFLSSRSLLS